MTPGHHTEKWTVKNLSEVNNILFTAAAVSSLENIEHLFSF